MSFFKLNNSGHGGGFAVRKSVAGGKKAASPKAASFKPATKAAQSASAELDESQFTKF
jgi:hypothetical protein